MISGEFNTFGPAIACSNGSNMADRVATTGNSGVYTNFLSGGESFYSSLKMILHSQLKI